MAKTKIEWTEDTWNPTTGCNKISSGCLNCYAEKMSFRLQKMGSIKYKDGFNLAIHPNSLREPYGWKKPRMVFVNSMSDLFHEKIPFEFIKQVFKVMNDNPRHTFQVLTKRSQILEEFSKHLTWTKNIWMGVTVEDENQLFRIDNLRKTDARIKFLSCEPLLSDLGKMNLHGIHWVIVGGESGAKSRPVKEIWVQNILKQCKNERIPFFFKQWGGFNKKKNGKTLNNRTYTEIPYLNS
jgi:protein gp37